MNKRRKAATFEIQKRAKTEQEEEENDASCSLLLLPPEIVLNYILLPHLSIREALALLSIAKPFQDLMSWEWYSV